VFFDAGRTNLAIAHALDLELEATIVTSSPAIAAALIAHGNIAITQVRYLALSRGERSRRANRVTTTIRDGSF
jgi:DeoR/GlpR family transcriptional regulator of sugar metabolism